MRPILTFTDFGIEGPYLGQMKLAVLSEGGALPVIDLMVDAPTFAPRSAAYLLAALIDRTPGNSVILGVVDPEVGGDRGTLVAEVDGRLFVGPENGLFDVVIRRGGLVRVWEITWRPQFLSSSFHGRDQFAPVAARLAQGASPEVAGCRALPSPPRYSAWPDDLAEIIYVDRYGNAMTGLRESVLDEGAEIVVGGQSLRHARTFSNVPAGGAFWYVNSCGLIEIAVNRGSAAEKLKVKVGDVVAPIQTV